MAGLAIKLNRALNVPRVDYFSESDCYVVIQCCATDDGRCLAKVQSSTIHDSKDPVWDEVLTLTPEDGAIEDWDVGAVEVRFKIKDTGGAALLVGDEYIGECCIPLADLLEEREADLLVGDQDGNPVVGTPEPHWPAMLSVSLVADGLPEAWPVGAPAEEEAEYPKHVFMMTRGTRGDVQPFVALARGMAETRGWLVTICTEYVWKGFVKKNADVSQGKIRFLPSGGNTDKKVHTTVASWAMNLKTEFMQMIMLANSEAEFFPSAPVIVYHVKELEKGPRPVDILVFGLTLTGIAAVASEYCGKPMAGFFLQPSCIPSSDQAWTAIQAIDTWGGGGLMDKIESYYSTSHGSLDFWKNAFEQNPFAFWNIKKIRSWFGLPAADTWGICQTLNIPLVIPMQEGTFTRPSDWWDGIHLTDFIFLRKGGEGGAPDSSQGEPIDGFMVAARDAGAKLALMTFSSMPVSRQQVLTCATKMVQECPHNVRLIYVGARQEDTIPEKLAASAGALAKEGRFLEVEKADFGKLFASIDIFIVHGGLGTTVEALRQKKPVCITGPLLLDQRFWGGVCALKGVGPEPVHIDDFPTSCVSYVNGASDPDDPQGWQATAAGQDWGDVTDDGVEANVAWFEQLMESGLAPVSTKDLVTKKMRRKTPRKWMCYVIAVLMVLALIIMLTVMLSEA